MSLQIGIVGLPNVGKSTLFKAITKKQVDASNYPFCTIDPNVGVVAVPDERLEKLAAMSKSAKTVLTTIELVVSLVWWKARTRVKVLVISSWQTSVK